jgi:MarR family transcriptional regulator for hemolysin
MKRADLLAGHRRILGSPIERLTRRVFTRVITGLARTMRDQELTVAQIAVLHQLDQQAEARVSALAEALELSNSATSRLVAELVRRGLVTSRQDTGDRRARNVALSASGRRLVDRISTDRVQVMLSSSLPPHLTALIGAAVKHLGAAPITDEAGPRARRPAGRRP